MRGTAEKPEITDRKEVLVQARKTPITPHPYVMADQSDNSELNCKGGLPVNVGIDPRDDEIYGDCRNCCGLFMFLIRPYRWVNESEFRTLISGG